MQNKTNSLIANELNISLGQIDNVIKLLDDGATIPFISRYRKEATGNLNEVEIQKISERYENIKELIKRKEYILNTIEEQQQLTSELKSRIDNCWDSIQLEDIYLPYKPKRKTRAQIARILGLEPLAKIIMSQHDDDVNYRARKYIKEDVPDTDSAISGALDIIAEWISENESVRNGVRNSFRRNGILTCKVVKGKEEEGINFENYFNFSEPLKRASSHRILAIRRAESKGILKVSIDIDDVETISNISRYVVRGNNEASGLVEVALKDSYKRLIKPSIENEFARISKDKADAEAIDLFAQNLYQLLFAAPLCGKRILGVDPGYRTGCKIVCLDEQGNLLHNDTIYPNLPQKDTSLAIKKISQLVESYKIDAIALGNGTASRETEKFLSSIKYKNDIQIFVVSENGASIYSASKVARDEFPDKDVTVRGAVSIGRRLLDPLAELVKIDPKSIGVGQYQYDVDQTKLKTSLNFTVESCVNKVGVNINTASKELLTYVSGLGTQLAQNIVDYRMANGDFKSRKEIQKVPRMGSKSYQQAAGFLRISGSKNPLDNSAVHPESYNIVGKMASDCDCSITELMSNKKLRDTIVKEKYISESVGLPTINDIMEELDKPGRDPRTSVDILEFDENVKTIDDVRVGMELNGIVTNLTQFGVFVDFGIKENGLLHISEICDKFISSPTEVLSLHQHIKVKIKDLDLVRKRISLTMKDL